MPPAAGSWLLLRRTRAARSRAASCCCSGRLSGHHRSCCLGHAGGAAVWHALHLLAGCGAGWQLARARAGKDGSSSFSGVELPRPRRPAGLAGVLRGDELCALAPAAARAGLRGRGGSVGRGRASKREGCAGWRFSFGVFVSWASLARCGAVLGQLTAGKFKIMSACLYEPWAHCLKSRLQQLLVCPARVCAHTGTCVCTQGHARHRRVSAPRLLLPPLQGRAHWGQLRCRQAASTPAGCTVAWNETLGVRDDTNANMRCHAQSHMRNAQCGRPVCTHAAGIRMQQAYACSSRPPVAAASSCWLAVLHAGAPPPPPPPERAAATRPLQPPAAHIGPAGGTELQGCLYTACIAVATGRLPVGQRDQCNPSRNCKRKRAKQSS